jgi:fructokinase
MVAAGPDAVVAETRLPTTTPSETLAGARRFFENFGPSRLGGIGLACFGPLELRPQAADFGRLLTTPKVGWTGADILGPFQSLGVPVAIDTDVNGAALAERCWGAGRDVPKVAYMTLGTGVGLGYAGDRSARSLMHPEAGHMLPRRHPDDPAFPGVCPFHGDCVEGLASGPAMEARWGVPASELPEHHPAWIIQAWYVAQLAVSAILVAAADRVVIGGGVGRHPALVPRVRDQAAALLGRYDAPTTPRGGPEKMFVPAELGDRAGSLGGIALAASAWAPDHGPYQDQARCTRGEERRS